MSFFWTKILPPNFQNKANLDLKVTLNQDTDLTDELFVRRRPVERLREYIKIKRLYNIPAEVRKQKAKKHLKLIDRVSAATAFTGKYPSILLTPHLKSDSICPIYKTIYIDSSAASYIYSH